MNKLITWLRTRGLTSFLVLLLIVAAGPLLADIAMLIDLITVVGADVFVLSIALYYRSAFLEFYRGCVSTICRWLMRNGLLAPDNTWLQSPAEFCRYLGHNLCVFSTVRPVKVLSLALIVLPLVVAFLKLKVN
jgi:hypothetical protein